MRNMTGENPFPKVEIIAQDWNGKTALCLPLWPYWRRRIGKRRSMVLVRLSKQFWCLCFQKLSVFLGETRITEKYFKERQKYLSEILNLVSSEHNLYYSM